MSKINKKKEAAKDPYPVFSEELLGCCAMAGLKCVYHNGLWVVCTEPEPQSDRKYRLSDKTRFLAATEGEAISWLFGYLYAKSEDGVSLE